MSTNEEDSEGALITLGEIPEGVWSHVDNDLIKYTVGIAAGALNTPTHEMSIVGSGTLVKVNDVYAILTADHVIGCLLGQEKDCKPVAKIGIVQPIIGQEFEYRPMIMSMHDLIAGNRLRTIARYHEKQLSTGPDIGVILLSERELAQIHEEKAFYDVAAGREKILGDPQAQDRGIRLLFGFPGGTTWEKIWDEANKQTLWIGNHGSRSYRGGAEAERYSTHYEFDYFFVNIDKRAADEIIRDRDIKQSLGGISGGSVWYVPVVKNGEFYPDKMLELSVLRGMVFNGTPSNDPDCPVYFTCHGWRSIYEQVYAFLLGFSSS